MTGIAWKSERWRSSARLGAMRARVEHMDERERAKWLLVVFFPWGATLSGGSFHGKFSAEDAGSAVLRAAERAGITSMALAVPGEAEAR